MDSLYPPAAILVGLYLLMSGGDRLVGHAAHLARSFRVPKTIVGALIIGFGTSVPELVVCLAAAHRGSSDIALGNVVGSNIANVGLILGCGALLNSMHVKRNIMRSDLPFGLLAALFLWMWVEPRHELSRGVGAALLVAFVLYMWGSLRFTRDNREEHDPTVVPRSTARDLLWCLGGLVGVAVGAETLVWGATEVARMLDVPERIIGVTVVALGTSLPELATTLSAARRNEVDLAVGNVAGSNVFNLLLVLGATVLYRPMRVDPLMIERDLPVLAIFTVLAFPLLSRERRIGKPQGLILVALYASYIVVTFFGKR